MTGEGLVVSGGEDGVVRLWDPRNPGDPGRELGRHDRAVSAVAVTARGWWSPAARTGRCGCGTRATPATPAASSAATTRAGVRPTTARTCDSGTEVAVTGRPVVSGGGDGAVRLWDPRNPGDPGRELGRHDGAVSGGGGDRRGGWWSPAATDGCGAVVGPAQPRLTRAASSAATTARCRRWR